MVGQGFKEIVARTPIQGEPICNNLRELPLGAQILKEKDRFEFEKDHWVNARVARGSVEVPDQLPDKGRGRAAPPACGRNCPLERALRVRCPREVSENCALSYPLWRCLLPKLAVPPAETNLEGNATDQPVLNPLPAEVACEFQQAARDHAMTSGYVSKS